MSQDIAKLITDCDKRAPSIRNITSMLNDASLVDLLRDRYAVWHIPSADIETDPEIIEALRRMELQEQGERRIQFDELHKELMVLQHTLDAAPIISAFRTIRDKITAHSRIDRIYSSKRWIRLGYAG